MDVNWIHDDRRAGQILVFHHQNINQPANSTIQEAVDLARVIADGFNPGATRIDECYYYPSEWDTSQTVLMKDFRKFRRDAFKRLVKREIEGALETDIHTKKKYEKKLAQLKKQLKDLKHSREDYERCYKAKVFRAQSSDHIQEPITDEEECPDVDEFQKRLGDWKSEEGKLRHRILMIDVQIDCLEADIAPRTYIVGVMEDN